MATACGSHVLVAARTSTHGSGPRRSSALLRDAPSVYCCAFEPRTFSDGAGNQWSKFLNGARPERMAALLELALDDWGNCQYSKDFLRRGYVAACQSHPRAHPERHEFWSGIKFDDLIVRVDNVSRGVDALIESLASRLMWRTEGAP